MRCGKRPDAPYGRFELGRILGLDYGTRRIGVAVSDPSHLTAHPLCVIRTERTDVGARLRALVAEHDVERIVVGLPVSLSGEEGPAAARARRFAASVAETTGLPVDLSDERFTTRTAEEALIEGRVRRRRRRDLVDKVAAAVMLGHYLDGLR